MSQLDLAVEAGVSTRHLSYVETGKSRPSPEMVLTLAQHLDVPLRERNGLLLAAGHAPRFRESSLDDPSMATIRRSIEQLLDAHDPYPALVIDRRWNLQLANGGATTLLSLLPVHLVASPVNVYRIALHPDGIAGISDNVGEWLAPWVAALRRIALLSGDPELEHLYDEVAAYPNVAAVLERSNADPWAEPTVVATLRLRTPAGQLALFTSLTTFGTPRDITLDGLAVELFWPADDPSADLLRSLAAE